MKHKTQTWILIFVLVAALAAGVYFFRPGTAMAGLQAVITVDGEVYESVDHTAVTLPYEFTVVSDYGYNTIRVSHGAIEVSEADCSEQVCVDQGTITDGMIPIVCLPHHMVIQIQEDGS